jgi:hypothetical protein
MRRTYWAAGLVVILAVGFLGLRAFLAPASSNAQSPEDHYPVSPPPLNQDIGKVPPTTDLAISQVILYSNGVGYFQREGQVQDNAKVDLTFPVQNINDLLKSMVLQDLGHGHISAVSYDSHDPIDKTLKSFAVNLTNNPSFGQILNQGRGEKVEVHSAGHGVLSGTLLGVESRPASGKDSGPAEFLNLLCDDGMRGMRLDQVKRVRFVNAKVEAEMRRALEVLASARDAQKKTVSLNFTGVGQRKVKVGYVVEQPVWRTSYRLLVNKNGKLFVQGWAIVENTSNEDWKDVKLSLVSGRPISFQMDLYQPLYVNRPTVQPEQIASIRPQTHAGAARRGFQDIDGSISGVPCAAPKCAPATPPLQGLGSGLVAQNQLLNQSQNLNQVDVMQRSVTSVAAASDLGDFFQYAIEHPVTVARQKSAMIPIVNKSIQGTKVSLYNPATHPKYPLLALELKNDTGLHLMQGPVTVFEGSSYAGDAQLLDLQRGEKRLVSYAIDLGTEVEQTVKEDAAKRIMVKIKNGIVTMKGKGRANTTYSVRNRAAHDRVLWIEHPYQKDFKLVSKVQPRERTDTNYRFELSVPAGKTAKLVVTEEKELAEEAALKQFSDVQVLEHLLLNKCSNPKFIEALAHFKKLAEKMGTIQQDLGLKQQELQTITNDQQRLRANLKEMPQTASAYKRYLAKFDTQETEIEKLQENIKTLQAAEQQQLRAIENFMKQLDVEAEMVLPTEIPNGASRWTERPALAPPRVTRN